MALADDLSRVAEVAGMFADEGERLSAVLATEPEPGTRLYLCSYEGPAGRSWLVVDEAGVPVTERALVRAGASVAALSEIAAENAGGGDLEELRQQLVQLRVTENPPGIEEAQEAALALERTVGAAPRVASPGYLDEVGAATRRLELALGEGGSPFAHALASAGEAVDALTSEVESRYKRELT